MALHQGQEVETGNRNNATNSEQPHEPPGTFSKWLKSQERLNSCSIFAKRHTYEDLIALFPRSKQSDNIRMMAALQDVQLDKLAHIIILLGLNDL